MEIAARLAKVTALIISRDVVIDYALYGTPGVSPRCEQQSRNPAVPRTLISRQIPDTEYYNLHHLNRMHKLCKLRHLNKLRR
jgi:hypothetical protein